MSSEKKQKIDYTIKPKVYFKENYALEKEWKKKHSEMFSLLGLGGFWEVWIT